MTWSKKLPENPVVAVAGATGAVGKEFLQVLHDVDFPASEVRAPLVRQARNCRFWAVDKCLQAS